MNTFSFKEVVKEESEVLTERRRRLFGEESAKNFEKNKFGIALSGGGIRSATINLGFVRTLNLFRILEKADYLSTVSGGGYTGAYIQATIKDIDFKRTSQSGKSNPVRPDAIESKDAYEQLFANEKIEHLRNYGDYLIPGQSKMGKLWNTIVLAIGFLVSWIMSLLSLGVTIAIILISLKLIRSLPFLNTEDFALNLNYEENQIMFFLEPLLYILGSLVALHLLINLFFKFNLDISKTFNQLEASLSVIILIFFVVLFAFSIDTSGKWDNTEILYGLLGILGLFIVGFFLNPNALSFHRFYRKQLADAFLQQEKDFRNLPLKEVFYLGKRNEEDRDEARGHLAPYPLINTCLNLQNPGGDNKFKGAKASDYFLLSPLFCGSKLSKYVKTDEFPGYSRLTLPTALTISAAAVNPGMGIYSNKMLSVLMTLFNARLGFWINNPSAKSRSGALTWVNYLVWWPSYFFKELFSKIGIDNQKLNISDGGHIENLGAYELIRRGCRLIMAVDAGADPNSAFEDLENLSIRVRNELGIEISFRPGQDPTEIIRPKPSSGYAQKRFSIADMLKIWEEFDVKDENGEVVTFKKQTIEDGKEVSKEIKLEALVNYHYKKNDPNYLKFWVELKAERGIDLEDEDYDRLHKKAVADVKAKFEAMGNQPGLEKIKVGTFVYIKSSVTAPRKLFVPEYSSDLEKNLMFDTFKYKIYHPEFPHESTADQFFDPVQWESYFQLGQYIAIDILDLPGSLNSYKFGDMDFSIDKIVNHFDKNEKLFDGATGKIAWEDVSTKASVEKEEDVLEIARPKTPTKSAAPEPIPAPTPMIKSTQEEIADEMQFRI